MAEASLASQNNSTNGRTNHHRGIGAIRAGFACLNQVSPRSAERFASYLFGKPRRVEIKPESMATMASAHRFDLKVGDKSLAAWSWGDGPTILLHHGWSGRASHLWRFVQPLIDAGFSVVAYDAPAHGDSHGKTTSLPEMARTLREVAFQLTGIHGVVGHSFGGAVALHHAVLRPERVRSLSLIDCRVPALQPLPPADDSPFWRERREKLLTHCVEVTEQTPKVLYTLLEEMLIVEGGSGEAQHAGRRRPPRQAPEAPERGHPAQRGGQVGGDQPRVSQHRR